MAELRIGNYIMYSGQLVKVTGVAEDIIHFRRRDKSKAYNQPEHFEAAIPTPALLSSLGFCLHENKGDKGQRYRLYAFEQRVVGYDYYIEFDFSPGKQPYGYYNVGHHRCTKNLYYVHQIQNLLFAIRGVELPFKLTS